LLYSCSAPVAGQAAVNESIVSYRDRSDPRRIPIAGYVLDSGSLNTLWRVGPYAQGIVSWPARPESSGYPPSDNVNEERNFPTAYRRIVGNVNENVIEL
jgi:hypothetical protein